MYPQIGELFKCQCGTPIAKRVGQNTFEVVKNQNGEKLKISFKGIPLHEGDPVQTEIICGKCGIGHILVTIQETVGLNSSMEPKVG
jgi:hypothetical protein